MPWRRFFPNAYADAVVGVCGGDEGPACWAKLKLGVAGRMAPSLFVLRNSGRAVVCVLRSVKASTPEASISSEEKEDEEDCSS